jgi:CHAD domain-containing protein
MSMAARRITAQLSASTIMASSTMAAASHRHDLLRKRLERFSRLIPAVAEGDVHALHGTRVASRRLRELLPVLQLDHSDARRVRRQLRRVTERLGNVRELDVLAALIDELHESRREDDAALTRMARTVADERAAAREKLLERKLPVASLKHLSRKLDRIARDLEQRDNKRESASPKRGWRWALDARVAHRAASLREALRDAGAVYLPDRLHRVRIAVKKLRYALELRAETAGLKTTPELRTLKRMQELLGRLHDLEALLTRVRQVQAALTTPDIIVWRQLDGLVARLENSCRRLHARYVRDRGALDAVVTAIGVAPPGSPHGASRRVSGRAGPRRAAG